QVVAQGPKAPAAQVVVATTAPPVDIQQESQAADPVTAQATPEATDVPGVIEPTEAAGAADSGPNDQNPALNGSVPVTDTLAEGANEADEAAALAALAKISVEEAKTAALAANPGTTVVKAELGNENGSLVYSVELSNGS